MGGFHLSKWYLDCIAQDGSALIGYWARLRWRSLSLQYAAVLVAPAGGEPIQFQSLRSAPPPVFANGESLWRCEPLQLEGRWESTAAPVQKELLRTPDGGIRWSIYQPSAHVCIRLLAGGTGTGRQEITGLGYVEELELTIPPWRLPFDRLYWGRFLSPDDALVWVEWQERNPQAPTESGPNRRRFAVLNGMVEESAEVTADSVRLPSAAAELVLGQSRPLREGPLVDTVFGAVPGLVHLLPRKFRRAHESKRLSKAELRLPGREPGAGWSIHEVVTW